RPRRRAARDTRAGRQLESRGRPRCPRRGRAANHQQGWRPDAAHGDHARPPGSLPPLFWSRRTSPPVLTPREASCSPAEIDLPGRDGTQRDGLEGADWAGGGPVGGRPREVFARRIGLSPVADPGGGTPSEGGPRRGGGGSVAPGSGAPT